MSSERLPPDDRELEDFLAGRHPVGRAYRAVSQDESAPRELDAAILAAARESVQAPVARRPRWLQPLTLAATLVLGVSVLMNLWHDPGRREQAVPTQAPTRAVEEGSVNRQRAPSPGGSEPIESPQQKLPERVAPKPAARAPSPPPPPPPAEADAGFHPQAPSLHREALRDDSSPGEPATAMSAPAAAAVMPEATHEIEARHQAETAGSRPLALKSQPKSELRSAPNPASADRPEAGAGVAEPRSVEQWIEHLRELLARGDEAAARDSLAAFRRAYPQAALPEDLRGLEASDN